MPRRKTNRDPESRSYSPETRAEIEALRASREVSGEYPRPNPLLPLDTLDALVGELLFAPGRILRIIPDREGIVWAKVCIRTSVYPRHYLLTSFPAGTPFTTCLEGILRKVEAFEAGALRPSPDRWDDA